MMSLSNSDCCAGSIEQTSYGISLLLLGWEFGSKDELHIIKITKFVTHRTAAPSVCTEWSLSNCLCKHKNNAFCAFRGELMIADVGWFSYMCIIFGLAQPNGNNYRLE